MAKPDPAAELRGTARYIRTVADQAAYDTDNDILCCWDFERIAGHERVTATRTGPDGYGDERSIVAVPTLPGIAEHIALWEPTVAHGVANVLDYLADCDPAGNSRLVMAQTAALALAKMLAPERDHSAATPNRPTEEQP